MAMSNAAFATYTFNIGAIQVSCNGGAVTGVMFAHATGIVPSNDSSALLDLVFVQFTEFFAGSRRVFDFPIEPRGTAFQRAVWSELLAIPYGETRTYGQIAAAMGNPSACRAVGMACGRNPIAIIVPCHRVIGANGSLTGFAGGLSIKRSLLALEREHCHNLLE